MAATVRDDDEVPANPRAQQPRGAATPATIRLNHYLAQAGLAARRKADDLIAAGRVTVNGAPASHGQQVESGRDLVAVDGRRIELPSNRTYLMINKPAGVLTTASDPQGRPTVLEGIASEGRLFPVGRLDLESRGLLLLTDDGALAMRLMHPRYGVEKEYRVVISGHAEPASLRRLAKGMVVRGESFQPATVRIVSRTEGNTTVSMVLREGRKREVRRLWQALGHRVLDLQRVRIDGLRLGALPEGTSRPLTEAEVKRLKGAVI